ncbi:MAG: FAD synthetase family protein [Alphaproteobacteria bacterium]|nr:FAD synthetase family protein [Alphaproteobacteria bacterium]
MSNDNELFGFQLFELDAGSQFAKTPLERPPADSPEFLDLMGSWFDAPDDFPREFSAFREYSSVPDRCRGAVVAIGKFDGVHVGHKALIDAAAARADQLGVPLGVLTFEPHPRAVFEPDSEPFLLATPDSRARTMAELGVDVLLAQSFDRAFAGLEPEEFVRSVLVEGMRVSHVVVGHDFRFGRKRAGDPELLHRMGAEYGFGVTVVEAVTVDGDLAGSTRLRQLIEQGRPRAAARVLGRMWEVEGTLEIQSDPACGDQPCVSLARYQTPAEGWYVVTVARAGRDDPDWVSARGQVGGVDGYLALLDIPDATVAEWIGKSVRVAFVDYLGNRWDTQPEEGG